MSSCAEALIGSLKITRVGFQIKTKTEIETASAFIFPNFIHMVKQIIQQLLEHQTFTSLHDLSVQLKQPSSAIENEIRALDNKYPNLLVLKHDNANISELLVRIAEAGEALARELIR